MGSPEPNGEPAACPHRSRDCGFPETERKATGMGSPEPSRMISAMSTCRCPICAGETHEIRAKLICRQCGAILETCCEGGPMGAPADDAAAPPSRSVRPENSRDD
jgi:hypothetical protein